MARILTPVESVRRDASLAFLYAFMEGRPIEELRSELPSEFEATGQLDAARVVRSFFNQGRAREKTPLRCVRP